MAHHRVNYNKNNNDIELKEIGNSRTSENQVTGIELEIQSDSEIIRSLKDGKRAWVVCAASFLIQVWVVGVLHAFGVFFVAFLDDFHCSKAEAAWVGSAAYGLTMALAPLASMCINRFGHGKVAALGSFICGISMIGSSFATSINHLYGSFTVVFALGCTFAYTPCMTIASDYFDKYLTLATGIMTAGTSTGTLLLSPIAQALVTQYGWRNAFRFFGCTCFIGVICALAFKPQKLRPRSSIQRIKTSMARGHMKELQLWKNKVYIIWICSIFSVMFGYYIPYVHLIAYAEEVGISASLGSVLMMTLGGATASGRVLFGRLLEHGFLDRLRMDQLSMVITGTAVMLLPLCRTFISVLIYVIIVGLVDGCYVVLLPTLTEAFTSIDNKVHAWGFLNFFCSISFTLGPPIAGWLYDSSGSYDMSFRIAGIPIICGAVLLFFIPWAQKTSHTTNLMTAAQSYNVMEISDATSPSSGLHSMGEGGIEFKTHPITIPNLSPPVADDADMPMITIRSPRDGEPQTGEGQRGAFVLVDLSKDRVMAFSQDLKRDNADEALPEVLAKAIDVIKRESGSVMSLERKQNTLTHGWSVERFSLASPRSFQLPNRLNALSPNSNTGSAILPTVSQLGRTRKISMNSNASSITTHTLTPDTNTHYLPANSHPLFQDALIANRAVSSQPKDISADLVDLSFPADVQASNSTGLPVITSESPPPNFIQQITSNPQLPPIAEVAHAQQVSQSRDTHAQTALSRDNQGQVGGDNARAHSRPVSPDEEGQDMFRMSDLSLTNFEMDISTTSDKGSN